MSNTKKMNWPVLMSALLMGTGQIRGGYYLKGFFLLAIEALFLFNLPVIIHGFWGLITLGETPQTMSGFDVVPGDHSVFLLIEGTLILFLTLAFIGLYIYNIKDAKKIGLALERNEKAPSTSKYLKYLYDHQFVVLMLAIPAAMIAVFMILPIVVTVFVSLTNYSSPNHIPPRNLVDWVGLKNFVNLFRMSSWASTFTKLAVWTLIWAVASTFLNYTVGLCLALLTARRGIKLRGFWRAIYILPYAIPAFISLLVFRLMFSGIGPINNAIAAMGLERIPFLTHPLMAKITVLLINTWIGAPYFMVLLSGSLTNIGSELYEASAIDGANKWQTFWKITFPLLLFQTQPILIMTFAYNFNNFGAVYLLTDGNPTNSALKFAGETDILISWLYKLTRDQQQYHMASVISILLFAFVAILSYFNFKRSRSFNDEDMM